MTRHCLSGGRKSWVLQVSPFSLFISNLVFMTRQEEEERESWLTMSTANLYTKKSPAATNSSVAHEQKDVNEVDDCARTGVMRLHSLNLLSLRS